MTEKRFVIESNGIWDNGKQLTWSELCEVLNDLVEENKQLNGNLYRETRLHNDWKEGAMKQVEINNEIRDNLKKQEVLNKRLLEQTERQTDFVKQMQNGFDTTLKINQQLRQDKQRLINKLKRSHNWSDSYIQKEILENDFYDKEI